MATRTVAIVSFLFTIVFFFEYTPLARRVHIPFDLESFHYPLADYASQAIRHGRLPQWDPTIYCGLTFAGNTQAGLFYPPARPPSPPIYPLPRLSIHALQTFPLPH